MQPDDTQITLPGIEALQSLLPRPRGAPGGRRGPGRYAERAILAALFREAGVAPRGEAANG